MGAAVSEPMNMVFIYFGFKLSLVLIYYPLLGGKTPPPWSEGLAGLVMDGPKINKFRKLPESKSTQGISLRRITTTVTCIGNSPHKKKKK